MLAMCVFFDVICVWTDLMCSFTREKSFAMCKYPERV